MVSAEPECAHNLSQTKIKGCKNPFSLTHFGAIKRKKKTQKNNNKEVAISCRVVVGSVFRREIFVTFVCLSGVNFRFNDRGRRRGRADPLPAGQRSPFK